MSSFSDYIGIPWEAGAQGPDSYDCMAFFRHVQAKHFGIEVPEIIAPDYDNPEELAGLLTGHAERKRWTTVNTPFHGCAVLVRRPMHVGVWIDLDGGGVLHCVRGAGVVFTSESSWRFSGFGRKEYLKLAP